MFTSFWQNEPRRSQRRNAWKISYISRFGADDYTEIKLDPAGGDTKDESRELIAYLIDRDLFRRLTIAGILESLADDPAAHANQAAITPVVDEDGADVALRT